MVLIATSPRTAAKGFSLEWHEIEPFSRPEWDSGFRTDHVELCLNFEGHGWIESGPNQVNLEPKTAAFFWRDGQSMAPQRAPLERHRFLTVDYSAEFLRQSLASEANHAHPAIRSWLKGKPKPAAYTLSPLTHRHHELLTTLLRPPVQSPATSLWYEAKALELASEFFFAPGVEATQERSTCLAAERVMRAKTILTQDLCSPPTLKELGAKVACSPFYLSRTFTRETGLTITQWLRLARLEKAAELLKSGRCNVTEAAMEVGYSSLSHFSMAFREQFGCCPGLYPVRTPSQRAHR